jgi:hypothetical protein
VKGGIGFNRPIWHLLTKDLSTSKRKKWRENRIHANGAGGGWQTEPYLALGNNALYIYSYIYKNCSV